MKLQLHKICVILVQLFRNVFSPLSHGKRYTLTNPVAPKHRKKEGSRPFVSVFSYRFPMIAEVLSTPVPPSIANISG